MTTHEKTGDGVLDVDTLRIIGDAIDGNVPRTQPERAWDDRRLHYNLVSPSNRRRLKIIVVGTGLAGAGAAAALGELGYDVESFTYHDAPRRARRLRPGTLGRQRLGLQVRQGHHQGR